MGTLKGDLEARLARAAALAAQGRFEAARDEYLAVLRLAPANLAALNDLGTLLHGAGYLTAARSCYEQAVALHADAPAPRVNLANMLIETGEIEGARSHYEAALARAPDLPEAHQGLARVLWELGDGLGAALHRERGFRGRSLIAQPWRGKGKGVPLLVLIAAAGGNVRTRFLIDEATYRVTLLVADYFDPAAPLPPHDLIFNAIGDADLAPEALAAAETLLAGTRAPVINPPHAVRLTGRAENARRLASIPGLVVPRIEVLPRAALAEAAPRFGFPLLLRRPGFHTGRYFVRVDAPDAIEAALAAVPGNAVMAIQYLDAQGPDGLGRKYRVMIVDGALYPLHLAVAADWKVHYFTSAMAEHAEHRDEEARFLVDMRAAIGPVAMRALERVRDQLSLDYGGIDFGLDSAGNVLLFEANAAMVVNPPDRDPRWDYRRAPTQRILDAVAAMLRRRAAR